jgi:glycosyltransferase involved in cell wall biosynthesis
MPSLIKVVFVGGPDVDARLELMHSLKKFYQMEAIGSNRELTDKFQSDGFNYYNYYLNRRVNPLSDLVTIKQLITLFRKTKPNIVHTFDTKLNVWGRLAAKLAGVPIIIGTITGLGSTVTNDSFKSRLISRIYKMLQTIACRFSDLTIFQNQDDAHFYINSGVVSKEKTKIILGSGVVTDDYSPDRISQKEKAQIREKFGVQHDDIMVTMISRVIRTKGVLDFAAVATNINAKNSKARFLLIGPEDPENPDALNSAEVEELRKSVIWPGPKSNISAILASSDIFVLPSAYREGIPRTLLEAASTGLPIITTRTPGCNEVVEDGLNGFLIPKGNRNALENSIIKLVEKPEMRRRFGKASRQRAIDKFDLNLISDQTHTVYQELLAKK